MRRITIPVRTEQLCNKNGITKSRNKTTLLKKNTDRRSVIYVPVITINRNSKITFLASITIRTNSIKATKLKEKELFSSSVNHEEIRRTCPCCASSRGYGFASGLDCGSASGLGYGSASGPVRPHPHLGPASCAKYNGLTLLAGHKFRIFHQKIKTGTKYQFGYKKIPISYDMFQFPKKSRG
jgi:hypothetical protein